MKRLDHEQRLTQCPRPLPQHLHGDDGTEGKDEGMDVLHVEVVGCHGIRDRVVGQTLVRKEVYTCRGSWQKGKDVLIDTCQWWIWDFEKGGSSSYHQRWMP